MSVRIVTDSTNYLPADRLAEFDIRVVPLYVQDAGEMRPETEIDVPAFYRRLEDTETLPTSSQPSPDALAAAFLAASDGGSDVLAVLMSSKMSGTVQAAELAATILGDRRPSARVAVLDSESNCMQEGFAVLSAARAAADGGSLDACISAARDTMARTRFLFSPASLEYLRRGGRISGAASLLGSLLKVVPVLTVDDGVTATAAKVRTQTRALAEMGARMAADVERCGLRRAVVHAISDIPLAEAFAREVVGPIVGAPVDVVPIGPVIGLHVGPAVGVVYETEAPLR